MSLTLRIETKNAAFNPEADRGPSWRTEVAHILRALAQQLDAYGGHDNDQGHLRDSNGNDVGQWFKR